MKEVQELFYQLHLAVSQSSSHELGQSHDGQAMTGMCVVGAWDKTQYNPGLREFRGWNLI